MTYNVGINCVVKSAEIEIIHFDLPNLYNILKKIFRSKNKFKKLCLSPMALILK